MWSFNVCGTMEAHCSTGSVCVRVGSAQAMLFLNDGLGLIHETQADGVFCELFMTV